MSDNDINAIFDLAADTTPSTPAPDATSTPEEATSTPQSNAETANGDSTTALYPNIVKTLTATEAGEGNPEGTLSIAEFAAHLTVENIKAGAGVEGVVPTANIYTATKAARHPLPVVLVFADDADQSDLKNAKVYLPVAEATEVYKNRPTRGESTTSATSKRSQDELLTDAAKKAITLKGIQVRLDRTTAQRDKAASQLEKYNGWLAGYYKATELNEDESQEDANKRLLNEAITARAAEIEEAEALKADAEKSDIPDTK